MEATTGEAGQNSPRHHPIRPKDDTKVPGLNLGGDFTNDETDGILKRGGVASRIAIADTNALLRFLDPQPQAVMREGRTSPRSAT
ncbi:hypothetical protein [Streptomyces cinnamoneus]|uniref:hypothetical protein n=1 Tax=Streptomyces cinnamoneus TaxID=53446 RepID=UPI0011B0E2D0|nr:hypothetical protein [Streptomyces cinnamoneus]